MSRFIICTNDKYIELTLLLPFHLIRYPNTNGISITGSGFLAELIPVVEGQTFTDYETYEEPIELIRKYSDEEVSIEMKITNIPNTE